MEAERRNWLGNVSLTCWLVFARLVRQGPTLVTSEACGLVRPRSVGPCASRPHLRTELATVINRSVPFSGALNLDQLCAHAAWVPVQAGSETDLGTALFSIYHPPDETLELPVHTFREFDS